VGGNIYQFSIATRSMDLNSSFAATLMTKPLHIKSLFHASGNLGRVILILKSYQNYNYLFDNA
jgi:hypothetical protein